MKFLGNWIELENIILSKVTKSQNNTYGMLSYISLKAENAYHTIHRLYELQEEGRSKCEYFSPS